eukprot:963162-Rhodomonas_salina.2
MLTSALTAVRRAQVPRNSESRRAVSRDRGDNGQRRLSATPRYCDGLLALAHAGELRYLLLVRAGIA